MIFYKENTLQHYLYNGTSVIAINPMATEEVNWKHDDEGTPDHQSKLDQALHSKARGFAALARYQIVHRGQFIKE